MKSGMLAAEAAFGAITSQPAGRPLDLSAYESSLRNSWVGSGWGGGSLLVCAVPAELAQAGPLRCPFCETLSGCLQG